MTAFVHLDVIRHCLIRYETRAARVDILQRDCLYRARGRNARVSLRVLPLEPLGHSPCKSRFTFAFSLVVQCFAGN